MRDLLVLEQATLVDIKRSHITVSLPSPQEIKDFQILPVLDLGTNVGQPTNPTPTNKWDFEIPQVHCEIACK